MFLDYTKPLQAATELPKAIGALRLAYSGETYRNELLPGLSAFDVHSEADISSLIDYLDEQSLFTLPDVILIEADDKEHCLAEVKKLKENALLKGLIIVLLNGEPDADLRRKILALGVNDLYVKPFPVRDMVERINFLVKFKLIRPQLSTLSQVDVTYKMRWTKRLFDILFSGGLLLFLLPFFLIIALLIRLESKGAVVYKSKRVGTGYNIFNFYKFRSMRTGADTELAKLSALNQYSGTEGLSTFTKLKNDPRVTRIGKFIRMTSIDELPQLFNVFWGDMSVVGNRPLPLYEAEQLTSNEWTMRFLGPAGLTGLWQVSRRGKADMSERERKKLDNFYAQKQSFWLDMKILLKTLPAMIQKEKV